MSHSGKDHHTYSITLDGGAVEQLGTSDGFGYYALVEDDQGRWYICSEDAVGFWHVLPQADEEAARSMWTLLESEYEEHEQEDRSIRYHERLQEGP